MFLQGKGRRRVRDEKRKKEGKNEGYKKERISSGEENQVKNGVGVGKENQVGGNFIHP